MTEDTEKTKKAAQEKISALEKKRDEDVKKAAEETEKLKGKAKEKIDQLKAKMAEEDKKAEEKQA